MEGTVLIMSKSSGGMDMGFRWCLWRTSMGGNWYKVCSSLGFTRSVLFLNGDCVYFNLCFGDDTSLPRIALGCLPLV